MRRRDLLRLLAAAPVAAGFSWNEAEASAAQRAGPGGRAPPSRPRRRSRRRSSPRTNTRPCACWPTSSSRATSDRAAPSTPAYPSSWTSCSPRNRSCPRRSLRQTAMRGGLAWLDLECQRRFDATFVACRDDQRTAVLDDISQAPPVDPDADPETAAARLARPRVLRQLPRSHRHGVLDQPDGHGRPAVPGQSGRGRLDRVSARGAGQARRPLPGRVTARPPAARPGQRFALDAGSSRIRMVRNASVPAWSPWIAR